MERGMRLVACQRLAIDGLVTRSFPLQDIGQAFPHRPRQTGWIRESDGIDPSRALTAARSFAEPPAWRPQSSWLRPRAPAFCCDVGFIRD
jgi:hypothetical protein